MNLVAANPKAPGQRLKSAMARHGVSNSRTYRFLSVPTFAKYFPEALRPVSSALFQERISRRVVVLSFRRLKPPIKWCRKKTESPSGGTRSDQLPVSEGSVA